MTYYPIFLDLKGKTALVVGGGNVAERKIEALLDCGAKINIISSRLTDKLKKIVEVYGIGHLNEEFSEKHLEGVFLVIAATNDKQLNHKISKIAKKMGLLINAVDQLPDCNFIVPSIVKRGDLLIAISTSGKSPALAQNIRKQLDTQFGSEYEDFLVLMGRVRKEILTKGLSQEENSRIFHEIVESDILVALAKDDLKRVESTLRRILPEDVALEECLKCLMNRNTL
ncbi:MAG: bifunctional precorrin-2 dehydrogenase/sirohydrochlorin ferrochelatase [Deltaproteobacteria bacterium]|nr:bifunctional precorrin-2 dehydrogenase/sirohydrochlorin ferrochelatase [Deltaproteobacteria bacterium]MBW1737172.1 bifunctional precorrin-2 dehydrogenase/sirohydrochlorin ferrochelatase [Deltaproteobacteria bacterium]MBW1908750.1 bifunctional precorrin-2 dehydrogenase/sirohydrochlorin ferrochelatase [Deltaproteobacteria bacterium]MBW2034384.1 bifunctional precorrin-2 dehydrogenase/sirohydrochlorin ferrochelatase [Deltaproteobacteria bacterium]MBW2114305.1 bifunctional precorrin-2 dehydrogena